MRICIHRGTQKIGGTRIEIETRRKCIEIDEDSRERRKRDAR